MLCMLGAWEESLDHLGLELQTAGSCRVGAGIELRSSAQAVLNP